jgi:hypothetical protein
MPKPVRLDAFLAEIAARKRALGLDGPDFDEALRNKGGNRTPEKRDMLRSIEERAQAAGVAPLKAYY